MIFAGQSLFVCGIIKEVSMKNKNLPMAFGEKIINKVKEKMRDIETLMAYYRCAIMEVETKLNVLNEEYSIRYSRNPIEAIKSRLKGIDSIFGKLKRKNLPVTLESIEENLNDIAGIRVICSFTEDVYTIANALLKQDDVRLINAKDYIQHPKPNGYRSLHLIIELPIFLAEDKRPMKVEIQLRTIAMDCWASLEHKLKYKKNFEFSQDMTTELYECAILSAQLDAKMSLLKRKVDDKNAEFDDVKTSTPIFEDLEVNET